MSKMVIPKDKGCFNLWSSKQNDFRPHGMVNSLDFINGFWMFKILKPISSEFAAYVSGAFCLSEFMCVFKCFCISLEQFVLIRIQETCIQENDSRPLENILPKGLKSEQNFDRSTWGNRFKTHHKGSKVVHYSPPRVPEGIFEYHMIYV